jgi:hypothetical protein
VVPLLCRCAPLRAARSLPAASGDPFKARGGRRLSELEDRYRHELMDDDERQELRDAIMRLRWG